ncbi:hypothetical protein KJ966_24560 [bacterium]|nr:hypothetical protein [bacterium]
MRLPQLTLFKLKKLILRLFPGLAGYHVIRYAKVTKVYEGSARDMVGAPAMAVDLQFLKHDFSKDNRFPEFGPIRLAGSSEFVQAPPSVGTFVLIHFPYWMSNTATVLAVLYLDRLVHPEEKSYQIRDAEKVKISAKSELILGEGDDRAVLGLELKGKLETLIDKVSYLADQVVILGSGGTSCGATLNSATAVQTTINLIKNDFIIIKTTLDETLSNIKIGLECDVSST